MQFATKNKKKKIISNIRCKADVKKKFRNINLRVNYRSYLIDLKIIIALLIVKKIKIIIFVNH